MDSMTKWTEKFLSISCPRESKSRLRPCSTEEVFDLVCVGFGPANLAIAIALDDRLDTSSPSLGLKSLNNGQPPRVLFIERQEQFAGHEGLLLPGAKIQMNFLQDLATLRNPRSHFTFINYLHQKGRLFQFTNLGTFSPQRTEYQDYLKWCSSFFEDVVEYGREVTGIFPESKTRPVSSFEVRTKDIRTGNNQSFKTRHVVIGVGGRPIFPPPFPTQHPKIIHSSTYASSIHKILPEVDEPHNIAVVGAGQSAAEIFNHLPSQYPNARIYMILQDHALRPRDDSPFVNEILPRSHVGAVHNLPPHLRHISPRNNNPANDSVVHPDLLNHIYATQYTHRLRHGHDQTRWPSRILPKRRVLSVRTLEDNRVSLLLLAAGSRDRTAHTENLTAQEAEDEDEEPREEHRYDAVICATGHVRDAHEGLLKGCRSLRPSTDSPTATRRDNDDDEGTWQVRPDSSVVLEEGAVASASAEEEEEEEKEREGSAAAAPAAKGAGVWVQGCDEGVRGLSDPLPGVLATRAGEVVNGIFGR